MFEIQAHFDKNKYYKVTTANRTIIGTQIIEFIQDKWISFSISKIFPSGDIEWIYKLCAHTMQGSAPIHYLSDDLEELQSDIIFVTDRNGNLKDIKNFDSTRKKMTQDFIHNLHKKYPNRKMEAIIQATSDLLNNKDLFLDSFKGYSFWRIFFQEKFKTYKEDDIYKFNIKKYFGNIDLPLVVHSINEKKEQKNVHYLSIQNTASLDKEKFDRKSFARMLKDLTGIYNIDAELTIEMEEIYNYKETGNIHDVNLFLNTTVANWYSVTNAHQLKSLFDNEFDEEMKNSHNKMLHNIILDD
jgi:hypothetical protein